MKLNLGFAAVAATLAMSPMSIAGPEVVSGPGVDPACFAPWSADTKFFQWPAKEGPYRIALANGYIANTWRIQMIQTAKAYAAQPEVAKKLKEFKVISTGEDVPAQISAINNFIDSGYDAIVVAGLGRGTLGLMDGLGCLDQARGAQRGRGRLGGLLDGPFLDQRRLLGGDLGGGTFGKHIA